MTDERNKNFISKGIALFPREIVGKGIITLTDQMVASATNFLTGIIIGRACTKEQFGLYILGFSIMLFGLTIQQSVISIPYMVYSSRLKEGDLSAYTGSTLIHQLVLSSLAITCLLVAGGIVSLGIGPRGLSPVLWALAATITLILLKEYIRRIFFARLNMMMAFVLDSFASIIQVGGLLLLANMRILSASRAYWVIGAACGIAALSCLVWVRKTFSVRFIQVISDFKCNWSLGKWILAGRMALTINSELYPWLLAYLYGLASTGVYGACMGIVYLSNPFLLGIGNLFGPKASQTYAIRGARGVRNLVFKASVMISAAMGIFWLVIHIFGGQLVVFIYGSKYAGNDALVSVLALSTVASAIALPAAYGLWVIDRSKAHFKANLTSLGVTLLFGLWLVKSYGTLGVACGLLISNFTVLITRGIAFAKLISCTSFKPVIKEE